MINPDTLPFWFAFPASILLMITWFVIEVVKAPSDPDPSYSRLDRMDGLPHTD